MGKKEQFNREKQKCSRNNSGKKKEEKSNKPISCPRLFAGISNTKGMKFYFWLSRGIAQREIQDRDTDKNSSGFSPLKELSASPKPSITNFSLAQIISSLWSLKEPSSLSHSTTPFYSLQEN